MRCMSRVSLFDNNPGCPLCRSPARPFLCRSKLQAVLLLAPRLSHKKSLASITSAHRPTIAQHPSNSPSSQPLSTSTMTSATMPAPTHRCRGFLMKHQLPSATPADLSAPVNPYDIVPCPHDGAVPPKLGRPECQAASDDPNGASVRARGCGKGQWCPHHWCAGCKRVNGVKRTTKEYNRPGELKMKKDEWVKHLAHAEKPQPTSGQPPLPA